MAKIIKRTYSAGEVCRLLGITRTQLAYWIQTGLAKDSRQGGKRKDRVFDFEQIDTLRQIVIDKVVAKKVRELKSRLGKQVFAIMMAQRIRL